jgi:hypothetical protein
LVIQHCEELREDSSWTRVGYHPQLAEVISRKLLNDHHLDEELGPYSVVEAQQTFGNSRVDFLLTENGRSGTGTKLLLEVKNVVGADYPVGRTPAQRNRIGVYEYGPDIPNAYRRAAIFPHGAHKAGIGVVSDRAIKVFS